MCLIESLNVFVAFNSHPKQIVSIDWAEKNKNVNIIRNFPDYKKVSERFKTLKPHFLLINLDILIKQLYNINNINIKKNIKYTNT